MLKSVFYANHKAIELEVMYLFKCWHLQLPNMPRLPILVFFSGEICHSFVLHLCKSYSHPVIIAKEKHFPSFCSGLYNFFFLQQCYPFYDPFQTAPVEAFIILVTSDLTKWSYKPLWKMQDWRNGDGQSLEYSLGHFETVFVLARL